MHVIWLWNTINLIYFNPWGGQTCNMGNAIAFFFHLQLFMVKQESQCTTSTLPLRLFLDDVYQRLRVLLAARYFNLCCPTVTGILWLFPTSLIFQKAMLCSTWHVADVSALLCCSSAWQIVLKDGAWQQLYRKSSWLKKKMCRILFCHVNRL